MIDQSIDAMENASNSSARSMDGLLAPDSAVACALREQIGQAYTLGYVKGRDGRCYEIFPDSVTPERAAFLESACVAAAPEATLEIGMAWGMSTLAILNVLAEGRRRFRPHVVIDPFQAVRYRNAALLSLRRAGGERLVEFHDHVSAIVLPQLAGRSFDFAFVDGSHRYSTVLCDLWFLQPLLKAGSIVVLDDVWFGDVQRACWFAENHLGYRFHSEYPTGPGEQPLLRAYVVERVTRDEQRFGDQFRRARARVVARYRRQRWRRLLRRLGMRWIPETNLKVVHPGSNPPGASH
jgi:predicted O-methyltransferase YrrM